MFLNRCVLPLAAVLGFLALGASLHPAAQANDDLRTEEASVVDNPKIDCSTNSAFEDKYIASAFRAGGGHVGVRNQQCSACHQNDTPRVGSGKPPTVAATAIVYNRLSEPIAYSVKVGTKGEWKNFELPPNTVKRHIYDYARKNQNKSPQVYIKYATPTGTEKEQKLTLIATPNEKLGSVYFFEKDAKDPKTLLWEPTRTVARR